MTSPTSEFWQALGRIGGDTADRLRWRSLAPTCAPAFYQAGLLRDAGPADSVYRPGPNGREHAYRVVRHGADDIVGVNVDDEDEIITLECKDAVDWAVDWIAVRERLVRGLGMEAQDAEIPGLDHCWRLGRLLLAANVTVAVYLAAVGSPAGLTRTIDIIVAGADLPSVILVPDASRLGGEVADRARTRKVAVVSLAERIGQRDRLLVGRPDRDAVFAEQREWHDLGVGQRVRFGFQAAGDGWDLAFGERGKRVRHLKGMLYLHLLLQQPNVPIPATRLAAVVDGVDESVFKGGKGQQSAHETLKLLNDRLREITFERDEAVEFNDGAKLIMLDDEKKEVLREVAATADSRSRERPKDDGEKKRGSVSKAIKETITAIEEHLPAMAKHLTAAMKYGYSVTYAPGDVPPDWVM